MFRSLRVEDRGIDAPDIGQLDMHMRKMDERKRGSDANPTVGIILFTQKDASVVRYSVLHENEQLFASRYKVVSV